MQLENLELLDLSFDKLTALPARLNQLKKRRTLLLAANNFSSPEKESIQQLLPQTFIQF